MPFGHRIPALDGVRGIAVLWVVSHNVLDILDAPRTGPYHMIALLTHPGWIGVQLFFVLSGFLITGNLLDAQGSRNYFSSFYARRALRIFPLYYLVLLVVLILLPFLFGTPSILEPAVRHQAWLWLYLTNWAHVDLYGFAHFWSLAVEEQFYLFWPLLVWRMPARRLLPVCLGICAVVLAGRTALAFSGVPSSTIYSSTFCHLDALALGGAGAALVRIPSLRDIARRHLALIASIAAILFLTGIPLTHAYNPAGLACQTYGYSLLALVCAVFVTGSALGQATNPGNPITRLLGSRILGAFGKYSYAIYVFHALIHKLIGVPWLESRFGTKIPGDTVALYGLAVLAISYALAFASYYVVEKPFLRLKDRITPFREPARIPARQA